MPSAKKNHHYFKISVFLLLSIFNGSRAWAKSYHYRLGVTKIGSSNTWRLHLVSNVSGRTVWTRTVANYGDANWSHDHDAVAIETASYILVWRKGHRLLKVSIPGGFPLSSPLGFDYTMGYTWSPDKKRLLVRFGASADADANIGCLWCFKFGDRRYQSFTPHTILMAQNVAWKGNREVVYQAFDYDKFSPLNTLTHWFVP